MIVTEKYLSIPVHLIEFWYPEGLAFFVRTWRNLMLFLEEDLAVTLMWRLIFTPLFHDSSIVGRILSFLFRFSRIIMGIFAFIIATLILFLIGGYFFTLPVLAFFDEPPIFSRSLFLASLGLFLIHIFTHPHKKIWQVDSDNFWLASKINKADLSFKKLLSSVEVLDLLSSLEIQVNGLPDFEISNKEEAGRRAFELAKRMGSEYISARHFFVAVLDDVAGIDKFLLKLELTPKDFNDACVFLEQRAENWRKVWLWDEDFTIHHLKGVNRGWLGVPTPSLDKVGTDLTREAASSEGWDFTREDSIISEVAGILSQSSGRNVILVGPPGSGKTALIRYLAKQIVSGDAPPSLATKRLVLLDLAKLMSGVKNQGDLADRVKTIFEEVGFAQNVIIVIEEIADLGLGEAGASMNLYGLMQPYLESDSFQFIGTTEPQNYSHVLEKNGSFLRIFRKIELPEATAIDTLNILQQRAIQAERKDKIKVTFLALKQAVNLSQKLVRDRVLPDSAISVLKESLAQPVNRWVTQGLIRKVISQRVKIPLMEVGTVDKVRLLNLESEIHTRFTNQDQAVKVIANTLRRSVTELREEGRPIGSFLFVGPTGVGKTELAKVLSEVYFKTAGAFVRFDMSEYQNPESVVRLIGGNGTEGELTESIKTRPYALLLLDEFEKADSKILTLFLQVLEDGRLTDAAGKIIDFTHTIIIATSNAGSLNIVKGLEQGKVWENIDRQVGEDLLQIFRPELINRFDDIVIFKPLSYQDLNKIVDLKITALKKMLQEKGYLVEFDAALLTELGKKGFDPILGARPLRRLIQDSLEANFSKLILEGKLIKGQKFQAGVELLR